MELPTSLWLRPKEKAGAERRGLGESLIHRKPVCLGIGDKGEF